MAAGLGFKTFTSGEVLTAADTNGYLMQGILVFASASARNAAITSPQEGQYCYLKDTNSTEYYDGAAWVSGVEGDISGVTAGTGISGGGTSGTVTVTNSMATAIDAKGDLVPGTGADTFARLAVGANFGFLQADSAQATGLVWNAGAWTTYTPTVTATTGSYTTITTTGAYQRIGKTCIVRANVDVVNKGTAVGGMEVSLPFTGKNSRQSGTGSENNTTGFSLVVLLEPSASVAIVRKYDFTTAWNNGWDNIIQVTYEVA